MLGAATVQLTLLFLQLCAWAGGIPIAPKGTSSLARGCPALLVWVEAGLRTQAVNCGSAVQR